MLVKEGDVCMRYLKPRYVWYVVFLLWVRGRTLLLSADYTQQICFTVFLFCFVFLFF